METLDFIAPDIKFRTWTPCQEMQVSVHKNPTHICDLQQQRTDTQDWLIEMVVYMWQDEDDHPT